MKYLIVPILISMICLSCYSDLQEDKLEGNIFDKDFSGELVTDVEFIHDFTFNNECFVDVYYRLAPSTIESMYLVNLGIDKPLSWISVYVDGQHKSTVSATDSRPLLESRFRINNVLFNSAVSERTLEFYLERRWNQDTESEKTLVKAYEFGCVQ